MIHQEQGNTAPNTSRFDNKFDYNSQGLKVFHQSDTRPREEFQAGAK